MGFSTLPGMTLFRQARHAVEAALSEPPVWDADVQQARDAAHREAAEAPREDVAGVEELDADGVRCRLYTPADARSGLVIHLHGGGFVFNDIEVHDPVSRRFANRAGLRVLSVDYRRPPEHRFPAAPDDVDTVVAWLERKRLDTLDERWSGPLYVHGDSAGGNLALVAALRHPGRFRAVVLIYPFLDPTGSWESYRTVPDGFDPREAAWYWEQYAASPADLTDPDLAPLRSDRLGTLPPTLVVTAEHDPLRDEGEELARRLDEEGVEVTATRYLGQTHGFWRHEAFTSSERLIRQVAGFLSSYA